ncbi:MAG: DUF177 domain-containing protein [Defluviitaleaceae bacterium]|nr:DUF177 domain-containing protein [Defluviitaleaceae bacterium]
MHDIRKIGKMASLPIKAAFDIAIPHAFAVGKNIVVDFDGKLTNLGESFLLEGKGEGQLAADCSLCLSSCQVDISFDVSESFVDGDNPPKNLDEDDIKFFDKAIDILPAVERNLFANIPMRFVCGDDCKGFCAGCGVNLNHDPCNCQPEIREEFASLLEQFKEKL